ncbi:MAG: alkaline phosphatase [Acidobacteria bacterium]|nr:MAG: alkaline phosphatase [Acidobacteriota bacterium]
MNRSYRSRRTFLSTTAKAAGGFALAWPAAARSAAFLRQDASRPGIPYGVASGDVTRERAIIWSRTDRPARMLVEWSTTESFQNVRRVRGPATDESAGYTARVDVPGLPRGQRIFYRVRFEDLRDARNVSVPADGSFLTAPASPRDVTLAWSADTVGQGWGINKEFGGLRMYDTIRRARPDMFIHCGDTIYADSPVPPEIRLPDGRVWRNVTTPEKSKVAETVDEFRGNYVYNLLDDNVRRFNAELPQFWLWDDHEVKNNWFPGMSLEADDRYVEKDSRVLAANARRAFLEYSPMRRAPGPLPPIYRACSYGPLVDIFALDLRTYRAPNSANRQPAPGADTVHAGAQQIVWLERALQSSTALWKVIASDLPIGLVVRDGETAFEAIANADGGPPLGRELEIADVLRFIRRQRIRNVVWVTGDVHYAAAHHYDPERARFKDFDPFWEFVAGPLHAGTFGPAALDDTFGPELRFSSVPPGMAPNRPPSDGLQFFGLIRISGQSRAMTVELRNLAGEVLYTVELDPK